MTSRAQSTDPVQRGKDSPLPKEFAPPNPYAVPLTALVAGAYVGVAEQVQLHPSSTFPDDVGAVLGTGFGVGGGDAGDSD